MEWKEGNTTTARELYQRALSIDASTESAARCLQVNSTYQPKACWNNKFSLLYVFTGVGSFRAESRKPISSKKIVQIITEHKLTKLRYMDDMGTT